ncbi:MAG: SDR family NAD(P)-dependent oxidoreductase [Actinobacteria bacterium]|nr:MAG: SDR family NAD(P)-dependent oxidoreductase [Actinomycetota bacterium]
MTASVGELDFTGKTILVTGSGRNIGRAIIVEFAARGANVIINARTNRAEAEDVEREARALGAETLIVMGEAANLEVVDEMKRRAEETFGRVDIYVSNAARRPFKDFWDTTNDDWHEYLNQQLTASWYLAKAFAPGMRDAGYGRIIHMNGPDGYRGGWTRAPHSSAKGALRTLTKSLAAASANTASRSTTSTPATPRRSATPPPIRSSSVTKTGRRRWRAFP